MLLYEGSTAKLVQGVRRRFPALESGSVDERHLLDAEERKTHSRQRALVFNQGCKFRMVKAVCVNVCVFSSGT